MKTIRTEKVLPVYVEFLPSKEKMEYGKIYISNQYNCSNHLCLCGCGEECFLPLHPSEWSLVDKDEKISVTPSIQQQVPCKSHYIITNGNANFV